MKKRFLVFLFLLIICLLAFFCFPKEKEFDIPFALSFRCSGIPVTEVKIGEITYLLSVDLGMCDYVSLRKEILEKIEKTWNGTHTILDINGNKHKENIYVVPEIKIGKLKGKTFLSMKRVTSFTIEERFFRQNLY